MKTMLKAGLCLALLTVVSGCAGMLGEQKAAEKAAAADTVKPPRKGLPAQELLPGECGLFLWTRRENPEFIFFSKAGSETAVFWLDDAVQNLSRTSAGGDIFGQQLTEQTFVLQDGRKMEMSMVPGDMLVGGQRVPEVSIRVLDAEGWATMIPAAGVTVCQPGE